MMVGLDIKQYDVRLVTLASIVIHWKRVYASFYCTILCDCFPPLYRWVKLMCIFWLMVFLLSCCPHNTIIWILSDWWKDERCSSSWLHPLCSRNWDH